MGCVTSKSDINDRHPNIFHVSNVNDQRIPQHSGKLEITETDLIYHQKGYHSVCWPVQSIRKYGCDGDMFTFECGRKCNTGEGIFAFKCERADQLFRLLQQYITGHTPEAQPNDRINFEFAMPNGISGPLVERVHRIRRNTVTSNGGGSNGIDSAGYLTTIQPATAPHPALVINRPVSVVVADQTSPTNISPSPPLVFTPLENNNYRRESVRDNLIESSPVGYENMPALSFQQQELSRVESPEHTYLNVDPRDAERREILSISSPGEQERDERRESIVENIAATHCYANLDAKERESLQMLQKQALEMSESSSAHDPDSPTTSDYISQFQDTEVNYAELDLDEQRKTDAAQKSSTTLCSPADTQKKKGYATIDFPKTIALSNSINPTWDLEEGSRKTRHNFTNIELPD